MMTIILHDITNLQAKALCLDVFFVPLSGKNDASYKETVLSALSVLQREMGSEPEFKLARAGASGSSAGAGRSASGSSDGGVSGVSLRLVFGDLHLQDVRAWREQSFCEQYECLFPLFGVEYSTLQQILWAAAADEVKEIRVSAWSGPSPLSGNERGGSSASVAFDVPLGTVYNDAFVQKLPGCIDAMGEKGEFHTHVVFK
jgi:hypothetical protein